MSTYTSRSGSSERAEQCAEEEAGCSDGGEDDAGTGGDLPSLRGLQPFARRPRLLEHRRLPQAK